MLDHVKSAYPGRPIHWVGHSYGGGFGVGLADNNHLIARHLGVAVPHGYWREMASPEGYRVALLMRAIIPLTAATIGYLPGKRLGLGENLPADVAREWASWIMSRNSMWDTIPAEELRFYRQLSAPMRFIQIAGDPWATMIGSRRIADAFTGAAERAVVQLGPTETGGTAVGHLGFFRQRFADSLWPHAVAWLDGTADLTQPSVARPL
jgi:predicted alpha/beta hydrolase